jgi:hypothetical protein
MTVGLYTLLFSLALLPVRAEVNPHAVCNQELMASFKLTGMPHPSHEKLEICTNVENNCCTMSDELTIVKYWREYTVPKIFKFASSMSGIYQRLFNFQRYITKVDFRTVLVHYPHPSWFTYEQEVCSRIEGRRNTRAFNTHQVYEEFRQNMPRNASNLADLYLYQNMDRRKLFVDSLKPDVVATLKNAGKLKQRFEETIRKAVDRLQGDLGKQNKGLRKLALKLSNKFAKNTKKTFNQELGAYLKDGMNNLGALESKPEAEQKSFVQTGRKLLVESPSLLAEQAKEYQAFFRMIRQHLGIARQAKQKALGAAASVRIKSTTRTGKQVGFVIKGSKVPSIQEFYAPEFDREVEPFPEIRESVLDCTIENRTAYRTFLQLNRPKHEHCTKVHQNMQMINEMDFDSLILGIRDTIVRVLDVKKTLYCSICDANSHKYFDYENGVIKMDEEFCRDLIGTYIDYIEFANVVMVQFGEQLLQYIGCINSLPQEFSVPFVTRFEFHKRNIFFFKRCFDNLHGDDYMRSCHFICSTFNFDNFSKLIDGDLKLMYSVYMEIVDFARNNNIPFDTSFTIDDEFLSGLNNEFYPSKDKQKRRNRPGAKQKAVKGVNATLALNYRPSSDDIMIGSGQFEVGLSRNVTKREKDPVASEMEVFTRVRKVYSPGNMRYLYFPDNQGLNPLNLISSAYIQLDLDHFVTNYYKKLNKNRALSGSTIRGFFTVKGKEILAFNHDLDLSYDPNLTHKPVEERHMSLAELLKQSSPDVQIKRSEREEDSIKLVF